MVAKPTGYILTVGDWFKNKFFGGYKEEYAPPASTYYDFTPYVDILDVQKKKGDLNFNFICLKLNVKKAFSISANKRHGGGRFSYGFGTSVQDFCLEYYIDVFNYDKDSLTEGTIMWSGVGEFPKYESLSVRLTYFTGAVYPIKEYEAAQESARTYFNTTFYSDFANNVGDVNYIFNDLIINKANTEDNNMSVNFDPTKSNTILDDFEKIINERNNVVMPSPTPYLSCPNGTKIKMSIDGATFLSADGTVTVVNKDGTAQVDNVTCQLGWEKPQVKYINDRAAIQTPDGKWQDAETGKAIVEKEPEKPTEPSNPSCNESDDMEVDSGQCEGVPYFGSKLEFIFGNATGNKNHIERSLAMELQLNSIGIFDDAKGKKLVLDNLSNAFDDPSSIRETKENGRVVRASVLTGPNGDLKVESVWDKEKLISVKLGEDVGEEPGEKPDEGKFIKSADEVIFNQSSIDKAFSKHRDDFGNYPDGSKASVELFKKDISELINTGVQKQGIYRNDEGTHIYNETTKQWTFINLDGTMNTAFKLSDVQFKYLIETGVVR